MKKELCDSCNINLAEEGNICPYNKELCIGEEEFCNCCDNCYKECLNGI